jgi:hypothetical protein
LLPFFAVKEYGFRKRTVCFAAAARMKQKAEIGHPQKPAPPRRAARQVVFIVAGRGNWLRPLGGLAVSRGLVEAHGGTLTLAPITGRGAAFILRLPVKTALPETLQAAGPEPASTKNTAPRRRALVIDDEVEIAALLSRFRHLAIRQIGISERSNTGRSFASR